MHEPVCDFCSACPAPWVFHAQPIYAQPMIGKEELGPTHAYSEGWQACPECRHLIEAGDREGLLARTMAILPGMGALEAADAGPIRSSIRELHGEVFRTLRGPAERA